MTAIQASPEPDAASIKRLLRRRSLVFVGLMGAGKTAIGRRVAALARLPFVDSDHEIEAVSRMSVADLFEHYGESEFRSLERRVVARLLNAGPQVLATGGGAFINATTRRAVGRHGVSVWLKADLQTLLERVGRRTTRPLLAGQDQKLVLERLMAERYPIYGEADLVVQSRNASQDAIAGEVLSALVRHLEAEDKAKGGRN